MWYCYATLLLDIAEWFFLNWT